MKKVVFVGSLLCAFASSAHADTVHINQITLRHLRTMCDHVLTQLQPRGMMYVKDYTMNEFINQTSGAVVGLDVITINTNEPQDVYKCHYDLDVSQSGDATITKMIADGMPVNVNVVTQMPSTAAEPGLTK